MEVEVEVENGHSGLVNSRFSRGIASTGRRGMGKVSCWMRWRMKGGFHRFDIAPFQYRNVTCIYKYAIITIIICLYDFICTLSLLQCATHKRVFKVIKPWPGEAREETWHVASSWGLVVVPGTSRSSRMAPAAGIWATGIEASRTEVARRAKVAAWLCMDGWCWH